MKLKIILAYAASSWAAINIGYTTNDKRQGRDTYVAWIDGGNPCSQSAFISVSGRGYCGSDKAFTLINRHTYYAECDPDDIELKNGDGSHNSWGRYRPQQNWCRDGDRVYYVMRDYYFP